MHGRREEHCSYSTTTLAHLRKSCIIIMFSDIATSGTFCIIIKFSDTTQKSYIIALFSCNYR